MEVRSESARDQPNQIRSLNEQKMTHDFSQNQIPKFGLAIVVGLKANSKSCAIFYHSYILVTECLEEALIIIAKK